MEQPQLTDWMSQFLKCLDELVPVYMEIPEDQMISNGSAAVCIIREDGMMWGKMYGHDQLRCRDIYRIAWTKASQVWITGMETYEYEKLVFNEQIDFRRYGIKMPDLIGYKGGQPVVSDDGTRYSIGFSGFRGTSDLEIVRKAVENIASDR